MTAAFVAAFTVLAAAFVTLTVQVVRDIIWRRRNPPPPQPWTWERD